MIQLLLVGEHDVAESYPVQPRMPPGPPGIATEPTWPDFRLAAAAYEGADRQCYDAITAIKAKPQHRAHQPGPIVPTAEQWPEIRAVVLDHIRLTEDLPPEVGTSALLVPAMADLVIMWALALIHDAGYIALGNAGHA